MRPISRPFPGHAASASLMLALSIVQPVYAQTATDVPSAPVARGKSLVVAGACNDCHTPFMLGPNGPAPDMARMLSGHMQALMMPSTPKLPGGPWLVMVAATNTAWAGPCGVGYTANLTPDSETGLGKWALRNFIDTLRSGRWAVAARYCRQRLFRCTGR